MLEEGDIAPDFTAPLANGDITSITLSEEFGEGPIVLAFFPGAFTSVCTNEMCAFRDRIGEFETVDARVFGISRDTPFTLNEFREQNDIGFGLISDFNGELVDAYDVTMDFDQFGIENVAKRAVFVLDAEGTITYTWISDDPGVEPEYEEVSGAAADAA